MPPSRNGRTADHAIEPLFLDRWSPRAFDGSAISDADLASLFEAARWAPSSYNAQPWRFVYARRDTPAWEPLLAGLIEANRSWATRASVLIYVLSEAVAEPRPGETRPSRTHSFDAGAAWGYLALQATRLGFQAHAMVGLEFDKVAEILGVPDRFHVDAAIAIGRRADKSVLSEALQAREVPSGRKPLSKFVFEGKFGG